MRTWRRRELLGGAGLLLGASLVPWRLVRAHADHARHELPEATRRALATSPYVYVSPLHPDKKESRCPGEVWFFEHQGDVVLATGKDAWKTQAIAKHWDHTRIWVGDHGRAKDGEKFRKAPSFEAYGSLDKDPKVFEALLASFGKKYPGEWGKWESRFREGYTAGDRVVLRYRPIGA